ncbi:PEP-CTERM sorting domain-containing protein [Verrucomicrobiaceae bacterium R5-34]|uniref:PEP-CTERM sorting domain-containing protein n=1 Tax=Oceaniferula flava TaxID=2800421 RepID=A0AAE2VDW4_9BACT|nr:PEP-CTERM sorting domain-containing protein [Oceaniferula flavus]MBK1830064.1 PEP-CTERM sorting domain-containing protein [Verrucomicrobiaceae bacterium R5-34]MBK1855089.1 PEP-CTERM sorting domain-containing protein [Oceaniferula flavus]MBM1136395.1 PEP-CTERM sorting domain-containing protein [Oceaniferula flavus]
MKIINLLPLGGLTLLAGVTSLSAATTFFDHDFDNGTNGDLAGSGALGSPVVGSITATGGHLGGNVYTSGNNGSSNPITSVDGSFNDVGTPAGNYLTATMASDITLAAGPVNVDFSLGIFGTNNSTVFKLVHVIGYSSSDDEVFQLTMRAGSGNATRELFARELGEDNTTFNGTSFSSIDGTKILDDIGIGMNSTNTSNAPSSLVNVSLTLNGTTWDASAASGTSTPATGLNIDSGATDLSYIQFFTSHEDNVNGQNKGIWVDDILVTQVPEPSSVALLGLGGIALMLRRRK